MIPIAHQVDSDVEVLHNVARWKVKSLQGVTPYVVEQYFYECLNKAHARIEYRVHPEGKVGFE